VSDAPEHYAVEQVAEGAWAAVAVESGAAAGNAGFARLEDGTSLVVDCGFTPAAARELRAAAGRLAGPVARLFVTHAHFDHYGGSHAFADVPILATAPTRDEIAAAGPPRLAELRDGMQAYLADLEEKQAPAWELEQGHRIAAELPTLTLLPPTETFAGEADLGGALAIECGVGHSANDSVVWLPAERVLFAGDLVGVESHLNLAHGDAERWLLILEQLAALEPDRVVAGHGSPGGPDAIATTRDYITTLLRLAAEPGEHDPPDTYAGWAYPEGFAENLAALRAR
jgi:cyclase